MLVLYRKDTKEVINCVQYAEYPEGLPDELLEMDDLNIGVFRLHDELDADKVKSVLSSDSHTLVFDGETPIDIVSTKLVQQDPLPQPLTEEQQEIESLKQSVAELSAYIALLSTPQA